jgi:hypothetical protein
MAAITSAVIAGASLAKSIHDGRKAKKAGRKANEAQRAQNRLKNKQAKRAYLRQFRQRQAAAIAGAVAANVGLESSAFQGQLSSVRTQAATGVREFAEADRLGMEQGAALQSQADARASSAMWGQVASFSSQFAVGAGAKIKGMGNPDKWFG